MDQVAKLARRPQNGSRIRDPKARARKAKGKAQRARTKAKVEEDGIHGARPATGKKEMGRRPTRPRPGEADVPA